MTASLRSKTLVLASLALLAGACDRAKVVVEPEPEPDAGDAADASAAEDRDTAIHDPLVEQEAVREALRGYDAALGARDPAAASQFVVSATFDYYEDLRIAALRSSREQLERWDLMSVILVLQIRSKLTREQLEQLDGRGLFEHAVTEGMVGEDLGAIALDEVWIADDSSRAEIRMQGAPVVWLQREDERWRVDIPEMIRLLGPAIEATARERVEADGKLRTALTFVEISSEAFIDIAILDGPLEGDADGAE